MKLLGLNTLFLRGIGGQWRGGRTPWQARNAAREAELRSMAEQRLGEPSGTVYVSSTATGAGDGSSWADAYTSLNTAMNAAPDGSVIVLDAPQSAPFPPQFVTLTAPKSRLRIRSNAGPSGVAWFDGRKYLGWTDAGSGIWSATLATAPAAVSYDIRQDDQVGTVTGVDLTLPDVAEAISEARRNPEDLVAWYGFLREAAVATTTPAEGFWSHTGGVLYINPPGSPDKADVDAKAAYCTNETAVRISGELLSDSYFHGDLRTFHTAGKTAGNNYGVRLENEARTTLADMTTYLCGYHAVGITNVGELKDSYMVNCTCVGQSSNIATNSLANPFVFYSTNGTVGEAGLRGQNLLAILFPQLDAAGSPILATGSGFRYSPSLGYSHTAGDGAQLSGVLWRNICQIDFLHELEQKHGVTINYGCGAPSGTNYLEPTVGDAGDWGVVCSDSYIIGGGAAYSSRAQYDDCVVSRRGRGKTSHQLIVLSDGTDVKHFRVRGGSFHTGISNRVFMAARPTDEISFSGVAITLGRTVAFKHGQGCDFVLDGNTIRSERLTNALLEANTAGQFTDTPFAGYSSLGGNSFSIVMLAEKHPAYPTVAARTIAELLAATDPSGLDEEWVPPLGAELATNRDFSAGTTGWEPYNAASSIAVVDGEMRTAQTGTSTSSLGAAQVLPVEVGKTYLATGLVRRLTGDSANIAVTNNARSAFVRQGPAITSLTSVETYVVFEATEINNVLYLRAAKSPSATGWTGGGFDDISVREVLL